MLLKTNDETGELDMTVQLKRVKKTPEDAKRPPYLSFNAQSCQDDPNLFTIKSTELRSVKKATTRRGGVSRDELDTKISQMVQLIP